MIAIGIDNGVTGTIGIITPERSCLRPVPTMADALGGRRIDHEALRELILSFCEGCLAVTHAAIEQPLSGLPSAAAIKSANRAFEAARITLEILGVGYEVISAAKWHKTELPGVTGRENLKRQSLAKGLAMLSDIKSKDCARKAKDCDGLLIADWLLSLRHFRGR